MFLQDCSGLGVRGFESSLTVCPAVCAAGKAGERGRRIFHILLFSGVLSAISYSVRINLTVCTVSRRLGFEPLLSMDCILVAVV